MSEDATLDKFLEDEGGKKEDSEWNESELGELLSELLTGGRPTGGGLDDGEYISIGGTQVDSGGYIDLHDLVYIPEDYFKQVEETQLQKHDILMVKDGANTGDVAIAWDSDDRIVTNEHLFTLRANSSINSPYLYYFLLSHQGWKQINGTITGSAQEGINRGFTGKVEIKYPPLSEQRKIATVLHNIDQAIQKTKEIIEQVRVVKEGVRQECIPSGVGEHNYTSIRVGPKNVSIPNSWEYKLLSDVCRKVTDGTHETPEVLDEGYPLITSEDTVEGEINFSSDKFISEEEHNKVMKRSKPERGDIIFTHIGKNTGNVAKVDVDFEFSIKNVALFKPNPNQIDSTYLESYLRSNVVRDFVARQLQGGAQDFLSLTELKKMPVLLPPKDEQVEIAEIISSVNSLEDSEKAARSRLSRLKRGLMQDFLSGTVRTTDTNIEVPDEIAQYG